MPHTNKDMNMVNQVVSQPMSTQRKQIANDYPPDDRKLSIRHLTNRGQTPERGSLS